MKALAPVTQGFDDLHVVYPLLRLNEEGVDVDVVAGSAEAVRGREKTFDVRTTYHEVVPEEYDFVLAGCRAPEGYDTVAEAVASGAFVFAVGEGVAALAEAGVLTGTQATAPENLVPQVEEVARYVDRDVVVDGKLVTGRGGTTAPEFVGECIRKVNRAKVKDDL